LKTFEKPIQLHTSYLLFFKKIYHKSKYKSSTIRKKASKNATRKITPIGVDEIRSLSAVWNQGKALYGIFQVKYSPAVNVK